MALDQQTQSGKWLQGVDSQTPVEHAARIAVEARLRTVMKRLRTVEESEAPDALRKLRVSLRRAAVALRAFKAFLPKSQMRRLRRRLNRVRRIAGHVRDCDMHLELVEEMLQHNATAPAAVVHVRDSLHRRRVRKQRRLVKVMAKESPRIEHAATRLFEWFQTEELATRVAEGAGQDNPTLQDLAREVLSGLLSEVHDAAATDLTDIDRLHDLRIACRRLRYAIELYAGALPNSVREDLYPKLIDIQDQIGTTGDLCTFLVRLEKISRHVDAHADDVLAGQIEELTSRLRVISEGKHKKSLAFLERSGLKNLQQIEQSLRDML